MGSGNVAATCVVTVCHAFPAALMFFVVCLFLLCLYVVALAMGWAYPGNSVASYFMWRILSQPPLFSVSSSSMPSNRKRPATSAPVRQSSRRRRPSSALHLPGEPTDPALASTGDDSAKTGDVAASRMAQNVNAASPTTIPPALLSHITAEVSRVVAASLAALSAPSTSTAVTVQPVAPPSTSTAASAPAVDAAMQGSVASALQALSGLSLPPTGPGRHAPIPNSCSPTPATVELAAVISTLLRFSLQPSSLPTYNRAWRLFNQFSEVILGSAVIKFPVSPSTLALLIAYLVQRNYAASTVNTYVSALG